MQSYSSELRCTDLFSPLPLPHFYLTVLRQCMFHFLSLSLFLFLCFLRTHRVLLSYRQFLRIETGLLRGVSGGLFQLAAFVYFFQ